MREVSNVNAKDLPDWLLLSTTPIAIRGLALHWPIVQSARRSMRDATAYLRQFGQGSTVGVFHGPPDIQGRFFYNDAFDGFNFRKESAKLGDVLDALIKVADAPSAPAIYVGSTAVDACLQGFRQQNDLGFGMRRPLASVWLGNRTRIAAHFDLSDNLACVVAGRRRFTLFAPEEIGNLYVGPLDFTPAGQAISLVDFASPDVVRFPRFADALERAQVVELEAGDAVFIPSLWWHHVESLDPFNALVNYWWRQAADHMDSPMVALSLALLTIRDLSLEQRKGWQALFQHYVFEADEATAAHVPAAARGALAPFDDVSAHDLRSQLRQALDR